MLSPNNLNSPLNKKSGKPGENSLNNLEFVDDEATIDKGHPQFNSMRSQSSGSKSGATSVGFNLINTAIGGGILGYPYIVRQLGIVIGVFFIIFAGILTVFATSVLQKCKNLSKKNSYVEIAEACFAQKGRVLCAVVIVINTLGGCILYLTVFATVVQNLLEAFHPSCNPDLDSPPFFCENNTLIAFGGLLILPFNFLKKLDKLKFVSYVKVAAVTIFTIITVVFSISRIASGESASDITLWPGSGTPVATIAAVPSIFFGYSFLYNQFTLYDSLKDPSDKKFAKILKFSLSFIGFIYLSVGLFGYLIYGSATDNMLINFKKKDLGPFWFAVLNIGFFICSLGGIPLKFYPAKNIIYEAVYTQIKKGSKELEQLPQHPSLSEIEEDTHQKDKMLYIIVVLGINTFIVLMALVVPGVNQVLGPLGSVGSASLMFLFPMSFYLKLENEGGRMKVYAMILLMFGATVLVVGLVTNILAMSL